MTAPARAFLASRVARRVFLLFVLSALVPLALILLLSMTQVRSVIIEQGEQRLARDAKAYASAAFDRLLDAADLARLAIQSARYGPGDAVTLQPFDTLARVAVDGNVTPLVGEAIALEPTAKERERLDAGYRVMRIVPGAGDTPKVVVLIPLLDGELEGWAVAGIRGRWLWGDPEEWPTMVRFCVLEGGTLAPLFCPDKQPLAGADRAVAERMVAPSSFTWEADGTQMRSVPWGQFLGAEFGADDWIVLASQPESELLKSAFAFRGVLLPAAVLALLAVIWLSLRMIRSTLTPLERLIDATRRLALRDFASRVPVEREDEFGELAVAFNAMARQLGSQFQALKTLAAIDREILSSHDMDRVMRAVLHHAAALVGAQATALVLLDENDRGNSRVGVLHGTGELAARPVIVGEDSRASVLSQRDGAWLTVGSPAAKWSEGVFDPAIGALYVYPIVWRDALCGMLAFGFAARLDFGDDERLQIRELAARMAVAVSSAWRDAQLYAQAHFDALTGLPNRLLFADRLCQHIVRCEREGSRFTLLFVDLDHFKYVNDTQGHSCGDLVLAESARRLACCVRATDTVARLGGDEFAIALATHDSPGDVDRVVRQVLSTLAQPFVVDGQRSFLGASIGVSVFPGDGKTAEDLLRNADTAMYRAKSNGRGQAVFYEERMNREAHERVSLDRELRVALERDELELHYQPQLELRTGRISGAEALLRWRHPEHGLVLPGRFIPVAEASDLIEDIGRWVIRAICRQDHAFRRQGILLDRLAANASARELHHTEFVAFVCKTMSEFGTRPASLEIEVTESMLVQRVSEVRVVLEDLKAAGVVIALDDFGVGFASMASLRDFPFDIVKIDRSFVAALPGCRHSLAIVTATIAISHALDKRVVAEGVETEEQLSTLRELGCDFVQGYLLGRPMPADAFAAFVREHGARRAQGHERAVTLVIGHASTSPDAPAMAANAAP